MNRVLFYISFLLLLVSCGNSTKIGVNPEKPIVLVFKEQSSASFFSDKIFGKMEVTPLETNEKCLVGDSYELLSDNRQFFIFDRQQRIIYRFDKSGQFVNPIGQRGNGPGDYVDINDYYIDPGANIIEILTSPDLVQRYQYDGTFISKFHCDISPVSFVKTGANYWFNIGAVQEAFDGQLIKKSEDGISEKFLPVKTDWPLPFTIVRNFTQCGDITTFREYLSHTVYHISDNGPMEAIHFDFGKYAIPKDLYEGDFPDVLDDLDEKGCALIYNFLENEQSIYIFFQILKSEQMIDNYHWIVNKKSRNSVLQKFSPDDPIYQMMQGAKAITVDNELIFMADAQIMKTCTDLFFNHAHQVGNTLTEDANPVIIHLKINDF